MITNGIRLSASDQSYSDPCLVQSRTNGLLAVAQSSIAVCASPNETSHECDHDPAMAPPAM